jgi:hypothetical protein
MYLVRLEKRRVKMTRPKSQLRIVKYAKFFSFMWICVLETNDFCSQCCAMVPLFVQGKKGVLSDDALLKRSWIEHMQPEARSL